jgi:hypothetical protein
VHVLDENVRQTDRGERRALEQLRAGDVDGAVTWYARHGRIDVAPTRDDALDATVAAWLTDSCAGHDAAMYAWRRAKVAELNRRARAAWAATPMLRRDCTGSAGNSERAPAEQGAMRVTLPAQCLSTPGPASPTISASGSSGKDPAPWSGVARRRCDGDRSSRAVVVQHPGRRRCRVRLSDNRLVIDEIRPGE